MTANTHTVESVLGTLKTAIKAQAVAYDLAWRGIRPVGALIEVAEPMNWLGHLEHDERPNFYNWLWAVAKPTEEGEPRDTLITAQAGYNLRQIADKLNAS